ncbi:WD40 repeat domain-containing protein [Microscilla marina]|uniref:WD40 repeat domain-containing protein n=1 Tax=Microscilla marina TaxID=1027 RepID=UPI0005D46B87|nr:WD40 repeat domain-containing protein [Microscilla marina]
MKQHLFLTFLVALLFQSSLFAKNLEAIAVHPKGQYLVTGGENRTLYIINTSSLKVTKRVWTHARIKRLVFNTKGNRLMVVTDERALVWYDTKTWQPVHKIEKNVYRLTVAAPLANVAVYQVRNFSLPSFNLVSLDDGKVLKTIELKEKIRISSLGLNAEGSKLALLTASSKDESEPKERTPRDLKGKERYLFTQKHDGRKTQLIVYNIKSGQQERSHTLWYRPFGSSGELFIGDKDEVYITSYANGHLKVSKDGSAEFFMLPNSYCYGKGFSDDGKMLAVGGLRKGTVIQLSSMKSVFFELDNLPGFPEYFSELTVAKNGKAYAVTDAFRVIEIDKSGKVRAAPVY